MDVFYGFLTCFRQNFQKLKIETSKKWTFLLVFEKAIKRPFFGHFYGFSKKPQKRPFFGRFYGYLQKAIKDLREKS